MSIEDNAISVKWPAARLLGPDVSLDNAMEFIRRTDTSLVVESFTNNKVFETQLEELTNLGWNRNSDIPFPNRWAKADAYKRDFEFIDLNYLKSSWICAAYIGGPYGPVSPTGKVRLAINFGKWPRIEEIEADLTALAEAFEWLTFDLSVWGHVEEDTSGLPSHSWHLEGGKWERIEPKPIDIAEPDAIADFMRNIHNPNREQTFTINQIKELWGERITRARAAFDSYVYVEPTEQVE